MVVTPSVIQMDQSKEVELIHDVLYIQQIWRNLRYCYRLTEYFIH